MRTANLLFSTALVLVNFLAFSQKSVVNEEINITKEREVVIPKATKLSDKVTSLKNDVKEKKMNYSFFDRKPTGIEEVNFSPVITSPEFQNKNEDENPLGFNNYLKVGVGNYGRVYGETYINSPQDQKLVFGFSALHNSTRKGPVDGGKSAQSITKVGIDGKYHQNNYELIGKAGYENRGYHFYGYDTTANLDYTKKDLRQRINLYSFGVSIENTKPKPIVDYKLSTDIKSLNNFYNSSEFDWESKLSMFFPIFEDKIKAYLNTESYLTQMSDDQPENPTRRRNLFRLEPGFSFDFGSFSARAGIKAVHQNDPRLNVNITKAYPTATLTYKTPQLIYFFAGIDGDIIRNTKRSLLLENPWLREQVNIKNTYKNAEYFIGSRGNLFNGLTFNIKGAFGKYQDLYYFDQYDGITLSPNGNPLHVTKFDVVYEDKNTKFFTTSLEVGFTANDIWKPILKVDYNYYEKGKFEKPLHRPAISARLGNTISITNRLVSTIDFYYIGGIFARQTGGINGEYTPGQSVVKLNDIVDINTDFTYLFTDYLSAFIKLNNILGKNYQRFYNYPQMGLNFLIGINIAI